MNETPHQKQARKTREAFAKSVYKALGKKPRAMREIATKMGMVDDLGAVRPSDAAKIRKVLAALIEEGKAARHGTTTRGTAYAKA